MIVNCDQCMKLLDPDQAWITDNGVMCKDCCSKHYPLRFQSTMDSYELNKGSSLPAHCHDWQKYVGLRDVYEYCDCGEKIRLV